LLPTSPTPTPNLPPFPTRRSSDLNNWLNPLDLVMRVPEVVKGYPDRMLPKNEAAGQVLKHRTLTNLYNERPAWLDNTHRDLDERSEERRVGKGCGYWCWA